MTKLQLLHRAVSERLQAAVEQIMEMVGGTVLEYEEETVRARTENEILRRRLRWMEGENATDWPDPAERSELPAPREVDISQPEQQHDTLKGSLDLDALIIKTESIEASDFEAFGHNTSLTAAMCGVNMEPVTPGTSGPANPGLRDSVVWDSGHSYMAPLDFDPTLPIARSRSQRMSFACPDCGKVFGREQRLLFHMRVHSTERPYAYRRRKTCFYGDKRRKKKLRGLSKLSREFVDDLSDTSEHTVRSAGSPNVSVSVSAEPSEASDGVSEHTGSSRHSESSAAKAVALKPKQRPEKAKIHQCQQCNRAYAHLSRLAIHMRTHQQPRPGQDEQKEQGDTDKADKKSQQHVKKSSMRNSETEPKQNKAKARSQNAFHCPDCNKGFARSCWLSFHLKSHERERALVCTQEKKEQLQSEKPVQNLDAESSKVEVIKKIFACPYCDKVFTRAGWLAPHIRSHTMPKWNANPDSHSTNSVHRRTRRNVTQSREGSNEAENVLEEESATENSELLPNQPATSVPECIAMESQLNSKIQISNKPEEANNGFGAISIEPNSIPNKTEESVRIPDGPTRETEGTQKSKKIFPCRECGKVYLLAGWLKTHKKMHKKERILEEKRRQMKLKKQLGQTKSKSEGQSLQKTATVDKKVKKKKKKTNDLEMRPDLNNKKKQPTKEPMLTDVNKSSHVQAVEDQSKEPGHKAPGRCICKECGKVYARKNWLRLHMLGHNKETLTLQESVNDETQNDEQTPKGVFSAENSTVPKGQDAAKVSFPCPLCNKVFPQSMRLMVHMQIHSTEKPYSYRQRKEQLYSDLTRSRMPEPVKPEPAVGSNDERKNDGANEMPRNQTPTLSQDHTSTSEPVETVQHPPVHAGRKFSLLPLHSAGVATTHSTNHPSTDSKSDSHFSLQPRIVLDQVTAQSKQPGGEDFRPNISETHDTELHQRSGPDIIQTVSDTQVNLIPPPLESSNGQKNSACADPDEVRRKSDSVCKPADNISCSEKVTLGDLQTTACSVGKKADVCRTNDCDYSEQNSKPDHTGANSSLSAKQRVPESESGYMVFSDISEDEDDWSNVSSIPNEKASFIFPSEGLADKGAFVISTLSPGHKVTDSDMWCGTNNADDGGPLIKRLKVVESEPQPGTDKTSKSFKAHKRTSEVDSDDSADVSGNDSSAAVKKP